MDVSWIQGPGVPCKQQAVDGKTSCIATKQLFLL